MSRDFLLRFMNSPMFTEDPFLSVAYIGRYPDHVGIQSFLFSKLRLFNTDQIIFYLPQLCHLLVSIENLESVPLEEFILELCEDSTHAALLAFWLFQTHLRDLSGNPQSELFKVCKRIYTKIQHIVFGASEPRKQARLHDNVLPVTLLAGVLLAGVAAPFLPKLIGPLAIAQARKPRSSVSGALEEQVPKISRSKTVGGGGGSSRARRERSAHLRSPSQPDVSQSTPGTPTLSKPPDSQPLQARRVSLKLSMASLAVSGQSLNSSSLPDLHVSKQGSSSVGASPRKRSHSKRPLTPSSLAPEQRTHMLRSHYFRSETSFLMALEDISNRLVLVPKPARLSALRAELGLLNEDLPAEVDIPILCPGTAMSHGHPVASYHRIVRINPGEATVLNSAERVPYLIMVEVLRDDLDFDPTKPENEALLTTLLSEEGVSKRRLFDLAERPKQQAIEQEVPDSVFEPAQGDIGTSPRFEEFDDGDTPRPSTARDLLSSAGSGQTPRLSTGANTLSTMSSIMTPRTSEKSSFSRSSSPGPRKVPFSPGRPSEQPDLTALATHMRTAAHMLAQLEHSSAKRPKDEIREIRAKIISSMQALEEQSFLMEDTAPMRTFDQIMVNAAVANVDPSEAAVAVASANGSISPEAGAERMENDQMTAGVRRQADRDDPSAATFGEEWTTKRERIRKSSPYGWVPNWDLISVIVKTGADLRQEAFACQLIYTCRSIWDKAEVPVWMRLMRILVTGETSGLVETITNGVSLHSLKRSLTLAAVASGKDTKRYIVTLKDHFVKTFGETDTDTYKSAEDAFIRSLAAYSIFSYIFQLKDRHNGNILIDNEGHIVHIDFGFMLTNSPGSVGFESAPFKLTYEYVDVFGGNQSANFEEFRKLCKQAFLALRKSADTILMLVEMMGKESKMPCFSSGAATTVAQLRHRFQLQMSEKEAEDFVDTDLIGKSMGAWATRLYDAYQYRAQGIY